MREVRSHRDARYAVRRLIERHGGGTKISDWKAEVTHDCSRLVASPNAYNGLAVGTTQLYNKTVVYNHKRHGEFVLGGRAFDVPVKPSFPKALSTEFLLVDLVSNVDRLAESRDEVLSRVKERAASSDRTRLRRAAERYGNVRAKKFFRETLTLTRMDPGVLK